MKFQPYKGRPAVFRCNASQLSRACSGGSTILAERLEEYVIERLLLSRYRFEQEQLAAADRDSAVAERMRSRMAEIERAIRRLTGLLGAADDDQVAREYDRQMRRLIGERGAIQGATH